MFLFRRTLSCISSDRCLVPVSTHVHNLEDLKTIIIQGLYCLVLETVRRVISWTARISWNVGYELRKLMLFARFGSIPNIHGLRAGKCFFGACLKREVASAGVHSNNSLKDVTRQWGSLAAFMRLLWVASWWSNAPCQFFCFVSCKRASYPMPLSSVRNWKEFLVSCWWDSKPLNTRWMDRSYHTRYLKIWH